jgi:hypothetical protein
VKTAIIIFELFVAWCVLSVPVTLMVAYCMRCADRDAPPTIESDSRTADVPSAHAPRPSYANG